MFKGFGCLAISARCAWRTSSFSGVSLLANYSTSTGGTTQTYTNGTDVSIPDNNTTA